MRRPGVQSPPLPGITNHRPLKRSKANSHTSSVNNAKDRRGMKTRGLGKGSWLRGESPEAVFVEDVYPSVKQPENEIVDTHTEAGSRKSRI